MSRVAIVAALEREVRPLVKRWGVSEKEHDGWRFRFFEERDVVLVCGGVGPTAARRAAEAVLSMFAPALVCSVGFAGALDPELKVGDVIHPKSVVNAEDGSRVTVGTGSGILVSFGSVASPQQKARLRESYGARAVDMEAAAVARSAEAHGIAFVAVKAISDAANFAFPSMEQFVDSDGRFSESRFAWFATLRPWLWPQALELARNSRRAAHALCSSLRSVDSEIFVGR